MNKSLAFGLIAFFYVIGLFLVYENNQNKKYTGKKSIILTGYSYLIFTLTTCLLMATINY